MCFKCLQIQHPAKWTHLVPKKTWSPSCFSRSKLSLNIFDIFGQIKEHQILFFQFFWMSIYTVYINIVLYCYCNFLNHILTYRLTMTYNTTTLKTLHTMASTLSSTRQNNICFPLEISLPITCQISPRDCGVRSK